MTKSSDYANREDQYPVNNWLNDIFGIRIIVTTDTLTQVVNCLDGWKNEMSLKNWYWPDKDGYRGLHVYFKNKSNVYFPWELQIWDENDLQGNIRSHEQHKRHFMRRAIVE